MRFSREMVWVCWAVTMGLSATAVAAQTTQHARLMVQAGGVYVISAAFSPPLKTAAQIREPSGYPDPGA
jgi:hypothetical protein